MFKGNGLVLDCVKATVGGLKFIYYKQRKYFKNLVQIQK